MPNPRWRLFLDNLLPAWMKESEPVGEDYLGKALSKARGLDPNYEGNWVEKQNKLEALRRGIDPISRDIENERAAKLRGPRIRRNTIGDQVSDIVRSFRNNVAQPVANASAALGISDPSQHGSGAAAIFPSGILSARRKLIENRLDNIANIIRANPTQTQVNFPLGRFRDVLESMYRDQPRVTASLDAVGIDYLPIHNKPGFRGAFTPANYIDNAGNIRTYTPDEIYRINMSKGSGTDPDKYQGIGKIEFPEYSLIHEPVSNMIRTAIHELGHAATMGANRNLPANELMRVHNSYGGSLSDLNPIEVIGEAISRNRVMRKAGLKGDYKGSIIQELLRRWREGQQMVQRDPMAAVTGNFLPNMDLFRTSGDMKKFFGWDPDIFYNVTDSGRTKLYPSFESLAINSGGYGLRKATPTIRTVNKIR